MNDCKKITDMFVLINILNKNEIKLKQNSINIKTIGIKMIKNDGRNERKCFSFLSLKYLIIKFLISVYQCILYPF